ncbi:MAG TPA: PIN domain-containing protein [Chloroflexi bacterium]|nr:PIN domain-containing protein [Chloroflexota bacterium]
MIIDASVVLAAFFPDEAQPQAQALIRDHVAGRVHLAAPTLLMYEVTNAVLLAERRGRIDPGMGEEILEALEGLGIELVPVVWRSILPLARTFGRSAYDGAYLALAQARGNVLVTGDLRLYHAVRDHLDWVQYLGNR